MGGGVGGGGVGDPPPPRSQRNFGSSIQMETSAEYEPDYFLLILQVEPDYFFN